MKTAIGHSICFHVVGLSLVSADLADFSGFGLFLWDVTDLILLFVRHFGPGRVNEYVCPECLDTMMNELSLIVNPSKANIIPKCMFRRAHLEKIKIGYLVIIRLLG